MQRKALYRALRNLNVTIRETDDGATITTTNTVPVVTALARAGIVHSVSNGVVTVYRA